MCLVESWLVLRRISTLLYLRAYHVMHHGLSLQREELIVSSAGRTDLDAIGSEVFLLQVTRPCAAGVDLRLP